MVTYLLIFNQGILDYFNIMDSVISSKYLHIIPVIIIFHTQLSYLFIIQIIATYITGRYRLKNNILLPHLEMRKQKYDNMVSQSQRTVTIVIYLTVFIHTRRACTICLNYIVITVLDNTNITTNSLVYTFVNNCIYRYLYLRNKYQFLLIDFNWEFKLEFQQATYSWYTVGDNRLQYTRIGVGETMKEINSNKLNQH